MHNLKDIPMRREILDGKPISTRLTKKMAEDVQALDAEGVLVHDLIRGFLREKLPEIRKHLRKESA